MAFYRQILGFVDYTYPVGDLLYSHCDGWSRYHGDVLCHSEAGMMTDIRFVPFLNHLRKILSRPQSFGCCF